MRMLRGAGETCDHWLPPTLEEVRAECEELDRQSSIKRVEREVKRPRSPVFGEGVARVCLHTLRHLYWFTTTEGTSYMWLSERDVTLYCCYRGVPPALETAVDLHLSGAIA